MEKVSLAAALRILADAIEAEQAAASASEPEWYDSKSYPFGERTFRRHVARGMKAVSSDREWSAEAVLARRGLRAVGGGR